MGNNVDHKEVGVSLPNMDSIDVDDVDKSKNKNDMNGLSESKQVIGLFEKSPSSTV